jgi:hypothetical protein
MFGMGRPRALDRNAKSRSAVTLLELAWGWALANLMDALANL